MKGVNKITLFFHTLFWMLTFLNHVLFRSYTIEIALLEQFPMMALFYWNYFTLIPYFFKHKKTSRYALWVFQFLFVLTCFYGTWGLYFWSRFEDHQIKKILFSYGVGFYIAFQYATLCLACRLSYDYFINLKKTADLAQQKRTNEFTALRSFVNIPFMLASLRLAEKQASTSPEQTQDSILKLSNVLKHNLYQLNSSIDEGSVASDFCSLLCQQNNIAFTNTENAEELILHFNNETDKLHFLELLQQNRPKKIAAYTKANDFQVRINISKFIHNDELHSH